MNLNYFKKYLLYVLVGGTFFATSCDSNDDNEPKGAYEHGVFITNEGQYTTPTAEVSFYDPATKTVIPDLFNQVNKRPLGDVAQSMTFVDDKALIVVNASNKIEVVNANTFQGIGVISGLQYPRYMAALNSSKGYVTEWITNNNSRKGRVAVLDLNTYTVTKTIEVGVTPEALLVHNGKLYVANSFDNTVTVINTATDQVETTLTFFNGPNSFAVDATGNIWVLCGRTYYNTDWSVDEEKTTAGHLVKFNPANPQTRTVLQFSSASNQPSGLVTNGAKNQLYYTLGNGVYTLATTATTLPGTPVLRRAGLYGLGVDPKENLIYVGMGPYDANGQVVRFQPSGTAIDSFQVRVLPNGFTFR
ncbi:DUF5074 domain-containing protein [Sabulibacter ruber]|uniref:DUF5074 domain-containing protein n=1 Tax=Sabulibacter ruber TaxID=2811901 RepID=UPI001A9626DD|nr:DUF5074 domain-containing protein [Sabulibacter ruber]